jgi:hypothetical protein
VGTCADEVVESTRMIEQHYGRLIESMDAEIAERLGSRRDGDQAGPSCSAATFREPLTWGFVERTTGFEPATPTLARWCSTN